MQNSLPQLNTIKHRKIVALTLEDYIMIFVAILSMIMAALWNRAGHYIYQQLLNVIDCAPDFAMKALKYRNDFDTVE